MSFIPDSGILHCRIAYSNVFICFNICNWSSCYKYFSFCKSFNQTGSNIMRIVVPFYLIECPWLPSFYFQSGHHKQYSRQPYQGITVKKTLNTFLVMSITALRIDCNNITLYGRDCGVVDWFNYGINDWRNQLRILWWNDDGVPKMFQIIFTYSIQCFRRIALRICALQIFIKRLYFIISMLMVCVYVSPYLCSLISTIAGKNIDCSQPVPLPQNNPTIKIFSIYYMKSI